MNLSIIADLLSVLGGITLIYSIVKAVQRSYRKGIIAKIRWIISTRLLPISKEEREDWTKAQKERYIRKLRSGSQTEKNTALDYIRFVDWDSDFEDAVSHLVCDLANEKPIRLKACELLTQNLVTVPIVQ